MPALMDSRFIERMKSDISFVAEFYDDPARTLQQAGVTDQFSEAVLSRDGAALLAMGWDVEEMNVAFSGRHTSSPFHCRR